MSDAAYAETAAARLDIPVRRPARSVPADAPLSRGHIRLIRQSYLRMAPASGLVAALFFRRLKDIDPSIERFLSGGEAEQRRQLLISLGTAVAALERFDDIVPALKLLGARYRAMGVTEVHYGAVGEALLWTLRQSLGPHWSADVEDAWSAMCTLIAEAMTAAR